MSQDDVRQLLARSKSKDKDARFFATVDLGLLCRTLDPATIDHLVRPRLVALALSDSDVDVREEAAKWLGEDGAPDIINRAMFATRSWWPPRRRRAVKFLCDFVGAQNPSSTHGYFVRRKMEPGDQSALQRCLLVCLLSKDTMMRYFAVLTFFNLHKLGFEHAITAIRSATADHDAGVREVAQQHLAYILNDA